MTKKTPIQLARQAYSPRRLAALVLVLIIVGVGIRVFVHGAGVFISAQPEDGSKNGQISQVTDTNASNHSAIKFNGASATKRIIAVGDMTEDCRGWWTGALPCPADQTSNLALAASPDAVLTLGDTTYHFGEAEEFVGGRQTLSCTSTANFFNPYYTNWGRPQLLNITYPAIGNHEYDYDTTYNGCAHTTGKTMQDPAKPYWDFFSSRIPASALGTSGDYNSRQGYYSYDLGAWHIIVLNSECRQSDRGASSSPPAPYQNRSLVPGGCGDTSPQYQWLQQDLATNNKPCSLAYWHRPVYASKLPATTMAALSAINDIDDQDFAEDMAAYTSTNTTTGLSTTGAAPALSGSTTAASTAAAATVPDVSNFWKLLQQYGVDVALTGHAHVYERLKPFDQNGVASPNGITQFIVGNGGGKMQALTSVGNMVAAHSATNKDFGVLQADLKPGQMDFQVRTIAGATLVDSGTVMCH